MSVVVGVSGSLSSLEALRVAVSEARQRESELVAVLAWTPVGGEAGYRRSPCPELLKQWELLACAQLRNSFEEAFGGFPTGLRVRPMVVRGETGRALVEMADRPDDLLVVGAGARGRFARFGHGSVSRYCVAHAGCRVLAVPPPPLLAELPRRQRHRIPSPPMPTPARLVGPGTPATRPVRPTDASPQPRD
ncbi:nucleotide-binding universal stress UspA family protein [Streptacidiphilus sp. MAP12-16]|jgi:nucleotide-binding universal stress UspA family protein|uniref:universal stress protein n=1 Tax=Streptacidiphilus sp. MAP12-16 TaxID=3156300 RepID=UPI0035190020